MERLRYAERAASYSVQRLQLNTNLSHARDALDGIVHEEHERFRTRSPEQARNRRVYRGPNYQDPQVRLSRLGMYC